MVEISGIVPSEHRCCRSSGRARAEHDRKALHPRRKRERRPNPSRRSCHKGIHDVGHLRLPGQNRLARSGMLVIVAITRLNEGKAGQRAVGKIAEVGRQRSNVIGIDAEGVRRIAHHARWLGGWSAGGSGWVLIQVLIRIRQVLEIGCGIVGVGRGGAIIVVEAKVVGDGVVNLPRYIRLVELLEDVRYVELR